MNNTFKEKIPQTDAIWGFPSRFDIRDLPRANQSAVPIDTLHRVVATSLSPAIDPKCQGIDLLFEMQNSSVMFDLELYTVDAPDDVLVASWVGIRGANGEVHAGNAENINLEGKQIKVRVVNPQNGWVTVAYRVKY